MSFEIEKEKVNCYLKPYEKNGEQIFEREITLPDYCGDIKKILKCSLESNLHSVSLSGDRANARGTAVLRVLYVDEKDCADVFEQSGDIDVSVIFQDLPEGAVVTAKASTNYVNCRAVSQRKISVNAGIGVKFTCRFTKEEGFCKAPEKGNIEIKSEKLSYEQISGFFEKTFDIGETLALKEENPSIGKVVAVDYIIKNESSKLSGGKLLAKGDLSVKIFYINEKDEKDFCVLSHNLPISQIIDVGDTADTSSCGLRFKVQELLIAPKADSSGENRLADISSRVSAVVTAATNREIEVITDCYCTDFELDADYEKANVLIPLREFKESKQVKTQVSFSEKIKKVLFIKALSTNKSVRLSDDKLVFSGNSLIGIYCIDENSCPFYTEKSIDFSFDYAMMKKCDSAVYDFSVYPCKTELLLKATADGELTAEYIIEGKLYDLCTKKVLKNIELCRDKPKAEGSAAVCIYFPDEGESLWDIARSHNTSQRNIEKCGDALIVEHRG